jgi:hypothetical protein
MAANEVGKVIYTVTPVVDKAATAKVGGDIGTGLKKSTAPIAGEMKKTGGGIMSGLGAGIAAGVTASVLPAVGQLAGSMLSLGTDLELAAAKADTVFGVMVDDIRDWASENAASLGVTKSALVDFATGSQDLLVPLEFTREKAAAISMELATMAPKFALWSAGKVSAGEASEILNKALLGERDGLQALGLKLSEADIETQKVKNATAGLVFETEKQAGVQATLDLILAGSKDAMNFYGTEAGQAALAMEQQNARMDEMKESAALALVPLKNLGVQGIAVVLDAVIAGQGFISAHADEIQLLGTIAAGIVAAKKLGQLGKAIGNLVKDMKTKTAAGGGGLVGGLKGLITPANTAALAVGILAAGIKNYMDAKKEQAAKINEVRDALSDETGTIEDNTQAYFDNVFASSDLGAGLTELGLNYEDLEDAMNGDKDALDKLSGAFEGAGRESFALFQEVGALIEGSEKHAETLAAEAQNLGALTAEEVEAINKKHDLGTEYGRNKDAAVELQEAIDDYEGSQADATETVVEAEEEIQDLDEAVVDLKSAIDDLFGATQDVDSATLDYIDSAQDLTADLAAQREETGLAVNQWDILTESGRDNISAARDAAAAIRDLGIAELDAGEDLDVVRGKTDARNEALARELFAAGLTEDQTRDLINTYGELPASVLTQLTVQDNASVSIGNHTTNLANVPRSVITNLHTSYTSSGSSLATNRQFYADGGLATEASIFGEDGPELAIPVGPGKERQRDNVLAQFGHLLGQSRGASGGGATFGDINVTVGTGANADAVGRDTARAIQRALDSLERSNA